VRIVWATDPIMGKIAKRHAKDAVPCSLNQCPLARFLQAQNFFHMEVGRRRTKVWVAVVDESQAVVAYNLIRYKTPPGLFGTICKFDATGVWDYFGMVEFVPLKPSSDAQKAAAKVRNAEWRANQNPPAKRQPGTATYTGKPLPDRVVTK
jgi:hypothetical protein